MANSVSQNEAHSGRQTTPFSPSPKRNALSLKKITYRAGPDNKERTKRNQNQKFINENARNTYRRPSQQPSTSLTPMPYVQLHRYKNKRLDLKKVLRKTYRTYV